MYNINARAYIKKEVYSRVDKFILHAAQGILSLFLSLAYNAHPANTLFYTPSTELYRLIKRHVYRRVSPSILHVYTKRKLNVRRASRRSLGNYVALSIADDLLDGPRTEITVVDGESTKNCP